MSSFVQIARSIFIIQVCFCLGFHKLRCSGTPSLQYFKSWRWSVTFIIWITTRKKPVLCQAHRVFCQLDEKAEEQLKNSSESCSWLISMWFFSLRKPYFNGHKEQMRHMFLLTEDRSEWTNCVTQVFPAQLVAGIGCKRNQSARTGARFESKRTAGLPLKLGTTAIVAMLGTRCCL